MTQRLLLLAVVLTGLGLAGCGAPDEATTAPGGPPTLRIVQPRPGQTFPIWDPVRRLGWVEVLFAKDDPGGRHGIRFTVGSGAPTQVTDVHAALVRKPREGTHAIRAWLVDADGKPVDRPGAQAEVVIHVGEASPR